MKCTLETSGMPTIFAHPPGCAHSTSRHLEIFNALDRGGIHMVSGPPIFSGWTIVIIYTKVHLIVIITMNYELYHQVVHWKLYIIVLLKMCLDNHDVIMLFLHGHLGKSGWKSATDVMQRVTIWGKNMGKTWEHVQGSALPVISWFIDHSN